MSHHEIAGPATPGAPAGFKPPSFGQETLWLMDQLAARRPAFNTTTTYQIRGDLDVPALRLALRAVAARHEPLRTALRYGPAGLTQYVADSGYFDGEPVLVLRDLTRELAPAAALAAARQRAGELAKRPFDLARTPLWRAELLRLAEDDHLLVFAIHHAIFDDLSARVFCDDLSAFYAASAGSHAPRPALPFQYLDYARWQREQLTGSRYEKLASYWRGRLSGTHTLTVPADRPRPAEITYRGAYRQKVLEPEIIGAVQKLARSATTTPYIVLLAAFFLLLRRYSGQDDLVIGTPVGHREMTGADRLIGRFADMCVLRLDLSGEPSFSDLLVRVSDEVNRALSHAEMPLGLLITTIRAPRDISRLPLFQVTFDFRDTALPSLTLPGLTVEPDLVDSGASPLDLSWNVFPSAQGMVMAAQYNTELFSPETIDQLLAHYRQALVCVSGNPGVRVSHAALLTDDERTELLTLGSGPPLAVPAVSIPGAFGARVRAAADTVALVAGDEQLSYAELEMRANRLGHLLREHGAGPGERVALCLNRTADLVVAMLAVLIAGAAYVPVDPDYPAARIAAILDDAAPVVVVAHADPAEVLPQPGPRVLVLEHIAGALALRPETPRK